MIIALFESMGRKDEADKLRQLGDRQKMALESAKNELLAFMQSQSDENLSFLLRLLDTEKAATKASLNQFVGFLYYETMLRERRKAEADLLKMGDQQQ